MSINRVVLVGRLTRDPELKSTSTGKSIATFSIAVNKRIKPTDGSSDADFFNVKVWGQSADYVNNYIEKGHLVAVDGRLEVEKWEKDGEKREKVVIVADNVNKLERGITEPKDQKPTESATDEYVPWEDE